MKNLILAIRAVYAAFARVVDAFCTPLLNIKGGGGTRKSRAVAGVFWGVFAVFLALPFAAEEANAQTTATYSATPNETIPDAGGNTDLVLSTIAVSDLGVLTDLTVSVNISHAFESDIRIVLISPAGTLVTLLLDGDGNDSPFVPATYSASSFAGEMLNGDWILRVNDWTGGDTGTLNSWELRVSYNLPTPTPSIDSCAAMIPPLPFDPDTSACGAACTDDTPMLNADMGICVAEMQDQPEMPENEMSVSVSAPATDESDNDLSRYLIGGGLVLAMFAIATGDASDFAFAPDYGYSLTESGYSVNAGGRMDFARDNWRLYWTAGQTNANGDFGDFRYSSGGKWQGDIFAAAFSESVQGETADYDLSLSANWTGGIWKVSPAFAIDSVYEKGEFQTTNSFRISGELLVDDWHFSASGNKTQMQLSAVREF